MRHLRIVTALVGFAVGLMSTASALFAGDLRVAAWAFTSALWAAAAALADARAK